MEKSVREKMTFNTQALGAARGGGAIAPADRRLYAIGDIHGRLDLLERLIERIRADATGAKVQTRSLIFLGDYIDRGPCSMGVIERLSCLSLPGFDCIFLKGNHEAMLLDFLDGRQDSLWLCNGGLDTVRSYGVDIAKIAPPIIGETPGNISSESCDRLRQCLRARIPQGHLDFLHALSLLRREGDYVFAHAGINPDLPLDAQREADLLWIRKPFLEDTRKRDFVVVHGHTTAERPQNFPHRIGIDTRAWASGILTALVLQDDRRTFLHT